jgi:SP family myo-inositol transporter-like MFS transporter 13
MSSGKDDLKSDDPSAEYVEEIGDMKQLACSTDQDELSGIESTAASKAAWLISIVVSIGGLLFGSSPLAPFEYRIEHN